MREKRGYITGKTESAMIFRGIRSLGCEAEIDREQPEHPFGTFLRRPAK